jgi:hypothetical protein
MPKKRILVTLTLEDHRLLKMLAAHSDKHIPVLAYDLIKKGLAERSVEVRNN